VDFFVVSPFRLIFSLRYHLAIYPSRYFTR